MTAHGGGIGVSGGFKTDMDNEPLFQVWQGLRDRKHSLEVLLAMYRTMVTIRLFDETVVRLWKEGLVPGTTHPYVGMEAGAVGVMSALDPGDYITSYYRGHGHALAKGMEPNRLMAEILTKESGYCNGRGGSMHIADASVGHLGATGIVGGSVPVAVGAALGSVVQKMGRVAVAFFGDGASSEGAVHEAMNLAAVWRLPVVFVCENNGHALSTAASSAVSVRDVAVRAQGYGMPGHVVDGQDVLCVYDAASAAVHHAREGHGPSLLELKTFRYMTHSSANPKDGRSEEEIAVWKARDPIDVLRSHMIHRNLMGSGEFAAHDEQIASLVRDAEDFAKSSLDPSPDTASASPFAAK